MLQLARESGQHLHATSQITSMATLEAVATPNSKDARSQWVNAYVSAARRWAGECCHLHVFPYDLALTFPLNDVATCSGMRTAAQRVHNVLGLGRESVKGRMLQQTFSAAQHAPAAAVGTLRLLCSGTWEKGLQCCHRCQFSTSSQNSPE